MFFKKLYIYFFICVLFFMTDSYGHSIFCQEPNPLIVIIENDPLLPGADMPRLVLYDNGMLIFRWKNEKCSQSNYFKKNLDQTFFRKLRKEIRLTEKFNHLKSSYDLIRDTDLMWIDICIFENDRSKAVSVYGFWPPDIIPEECLRSRQYSFVRNTQYRNQPLKYPDPDDWNFDNIPKPVMPDRLPEEFKRIYEYMINIATYDHNSEIWRPDYIEIIIWSGSPGTQNIIWPKKWPDINDPLTRHRGENMYSLYMPYCNFEEFQSYLSLLNGNNILMDGKGWSLAYRFLFPNEDVWLKLLKYK